MVSEALKAVFCCSFFVVFLYFLVIEKHYTFSVTCSKTTLDSSETTPNPSKGGEYTPPKEASSYSPYSEASSYSPPLEGLGV
ncbi:MAG: hypothetical protein LBC74_09180, partial [Planctomycetaceae bacterium]|nr:hypothetical protein [Planctomycetaceae bacterium]